MQYGRLLVGTIDASRRYVFVVLPKYYDQNTFITAEAKKEKKKTIFCISRILEDIILNLGVINLN